MYSMSMTVPFLVIALTPHLERIHWTPEWQCVALPCHGFFCWLVSKVDLLSGLVGRDKEAASRRWQVEIFFWRKKDGWRKRDSDLFQHEI